MAPLRRNIAIDSGTADSNAVFPYVLRQYLVKADIFRVVQDPDYALSPPTRIGNVVSLLTTTLLILLCVSETVSFFTPDIRSSVHLDPAPQNLSFHSDGHGSDALGNEDDLHFRIIFPNTVCSTIGAQLVIGNRIVFSSMSLKDARSTNEKGVLNQKETQPGMDALQDPPMRILLQQWDPDVANLTAAQRLRGGYAVYFVSDAYLLRTLEESLVAGEEPDVAAERLQNPPHPSGCEFTGHVNIPSFPNTLQIFNTASMNNEKNAKDPWGPVNVFRFMRTPEETQYFSQYSIEEFQFGRARLDETFPFIDRTLTESLRSTSVDNKRAMEPSARFDMKLYQYYIQIVPTYVIPYGIEGDNIRDDVLRRSRTADACGTDAALNCKSVRGTQYTATYAATFIQHGFMNTYRSNPHVHPNHPKEGIYFHFRHSPVSVVYVRTYDRWMHFVVHLCAAVGGVFATTNLIEWLLEKIVHISRRVLRIS